MRATASTQVRHGERIESAVRLAAAWAFGPAATIPAHASIFSGDTLDLVANILAWVVLFVAPVIAIGVFWIVHILPEKIAEKRRHPQLGAIKTLCLLSLFFGGILWPLAWLWAYSKPVLYKVAYGTDMAEPHPEPPAAPGTQSAPQAVEREVEPVQDLEAPDPNSAESRQHATRVSALDARH